MKFPPHATEVECMSGCQYITVQQFQVVVVVVKRCVLLGRRSEAVSG